VGQRNRERRRGERRAHMSPWVPIAFRRVSPRPAFADESLERRFDVARDVSSAGAGRLEHDPGRRVRHEEREQGAVVAGNGIAHLGGDVEQLCLPLRFERERAHTRIVRYNSFVRTIGCVAAVLLVLVPLAGAEPNPGPGFSAVSNARPAWSPDGRRIAYVTNAFGHGQIEVIDLARRRVQRITNDSVRDVSAHWLANGRLVLLGEAKGRYFIGSVDRHGHTVVSMRFTGTVYSVAWSPDGRRIAVEEGANPLSPDIWIENADGTNQRPLVSAAGQPAWSPDGKRIAFVDGSDTASSGLELVDADGNNRVRL